LPKRRKEGNKFTTISITWSDKEILREYARYKKETKNGKLYESDAEIFNRIMSEYITTHLAVHDGKPTYPTALQDVHQRD